MTALPLPLLVWLSPGFPVGGFAYSHGLEWAVESGAVGDGAALQTWLGDLLEHGGPRADAVLLASAWQAGGSCAQAAGVQATVAQACAIQDAVAQACAIQDAVAQACAINELALALAPSRERRLETGAQGTAFLEAVRPAWPAPALELFAAALPDGEAAYPVAVGLAAAAHGIALRPTLDAFCFAALANLASAALRLGVVGQSEAQRVIAALCPALERLAAFAGTATLADCGTAAWQADVASMRHETQYSRLFRS